MFLGDLDAEILKLHGSHSSKSEISSFPRAPGIHVLQLISDGNPVFIFQVSAQQKVVYTRANSSINMSMSVAKNMHASTPNLLVSVYKPKLSRRGGEAIDHTNNFESCAIRRFLEHVL